MFIILSRVLEWSAIYRSTMMSKAFFYGLSLAFLSACATVPEEYTPPPDLDKNPYAKLYEGKSETIFATLFPPGTVEEAIVMGDTAVSQGNHDEALFRYVQALYIDDSIADTFYKIGAIHTARNSDELAKQAYIQALLRKEDYAEAVEALGLTQLDLQEYAAAEDTLIRAKSLRPQSWQTLNALGILTDINKKHSAAQVLYKQAIEINPDYLMLRVNLGYSTYLAGEYHQAISIFNKVLTEDSTQNRAWMNLGLAYFKIGRYQKAVKSFNQVVNIADAYNNVGYLSFLQARRDPKSESTGELVDIAKSYFQLAIKLSEKYHAEAEKNLRDLEEWVLTERRVQN